MFASIDLNSGQNWETDAHKLEFQRVQQAFQYFVGIDVHRHYKLDRIIVLNNTVLEERFIQTYNKIGAKKVQSDWESESNPNKAWQEQVIQRVCLDYVVEILTSTARRFCEKCLW